MSRVKKFALGVIAAAAVVLFAGCEPPVNVPEIEQGYRSDTIGNISFIYNEDVTVRDIGETRYYYFSDTAFFFAASESLNSGAKTAGLPEAQLFFKNAEDSLNEDVWSGCERISEIEKGVFNGVEVWMCEFQTNHSVTGIRFTCSSAFTFQNGLLTEFTLVAYPDSYETVVAEFAKTLASVTLAN